MLSGKGSVSETETESVSRIVVYIVGREKRQASSYLEPREIEREVEERRKGKRRNKDAHVAGK